MRYKILICVFLVCMLVSLVVIGFILAPYVYAEITIGNPYDHPNYAGVLSIPSVGIEVPCVNCDGMDGEFRKIAVHKTNCAAMFSRAAKSVFTSNKPTDPCSVTVIGDHYFQKFSTLKNCEIGNSATLTNPDGSVDNYVVVKVFEGINNDKDLVYGSGDSVLPDNLGGIVLYTCMDMTAVPVYIVFLQPKS